MSANRRLLLRRRPEDRVSLDDFTVDEAPVPEPGEGEAVLRTIYLSLDPTNRVWMAADSYLPAVKEGAVMRGLGLAQVVASRDERYQVGDLAVGAPGWQEYSTSAEAEMPWNVLPRGTGLPPTMMLGALGMTGLTAYWGIVDVCAPKEGETVVVIAGAGGVGSLAVQLARRWGAGRVIATASSPEKRALAEELGAHATVDPALATDDPKTFTGALREANGGKPVDVVLEMTGGHVFTGSLSALAPFGRLVTYGMAARQETPPVPPGALMQKSRAVIGFWLAHCMARPQMMDAAMHDLLPMVAEGALKPVVGGRYPMSAVREAHQDLLARRTTGKLVLDPSR